MGGDYTFVDVYEVGDTVPFEIYAGETPDYATYEISAMPSL